MEIKYKFNDYEFTFDDQLFFKIYDQEWCFGIIFEIENFRYEVVHNRVGMTRIFINGADGSMKDIPFNDNTVKILPKCIKSEKYENQ